MICLISCQSNVLCFIKKSKKSLDNCVVYHIIIVSQATKPK
uniref:Uncharacterized protein n=1 Tax=Melanothamnus harveyi TaxID=397005 RepID=A0A1Z1MHB4_MELHR|nr:hypothetical protein [Melanothamnus harveyi]ARW65460.1 hypothetical protein [Melanothamnus harveyi]